MPNRVVYCVLNKSPGISFLVSKMNLTDALDKIMRADSETVEALDSELVQNQVKELRQIYQQRGGEL